MSNYWMLDEEFINKQDFKDKFYLREVLRSVNRYVSVFCPIPINIQWSERYNLMKFKVGGDHFLGLKVVPDVYERDYTYIVEKWASQFFPKYSVDVETRRNLSPEEISERINSGGNIEDLLNESVVISESLDGTIFKIRRASDDILIKENGFLITKTCKKPVSQFLRELRGIDNDYRKLEYINENSIETNRFNHKIKPIYIKLVNQYFTRNFFRNRVNYEENCSLLPTDEPNWYSWNNYRIFIESKYLFETCTDIVENKDTNRPVILYKDNTNMES